MANTSVKLSGERYSNIYDLKVKDTNNVTQDINHLIVNKDGNLYGIWSRYVVFDTYKSGDIPRIGFCTKIRGDTRGYYADRPHIYTREDNSSPYHRSKILVPYVQNTTQEEELDNSTGYHNPEGAVTYVFPVWYLPQTCENDPHNRIKNSINGGQIIKMANGPTTISGMSCNVYTKILTNVTSTWTGNKFPQRGWSWSGSGSRYTKSFQFSSDYYNSDVLNNKILSYNFSSSHANSNGSIDSSGLYYNKLTLNSSAWTLVGCKVDYIDNFGKRHVSDIGGNSVLKVLIGSEVYLTPYLLEQSVNDTSGYATATGTGVSIKCGLLKGKVDINTNYPNSFLIQDDITITIDRATNTKADYGPGSVSYTFADSWQQINTVGSSARRTTIDYYSTYDSSFAPSDTRYTVVRENGNIRGWIKPSNPLVHKSYTIPNGVNSSGLSCRWNLYYFQFHYDANGFITTIDFKSNEASTYSFWIYLV